MVINVIQTYSYTNLWPKRAESYATRSLPLGGANNQFWSIRKYSEKRCLIDVVRAIFRGSTRRLPCFKFSLFEGGGPRLQLCPPDLINLPLFTARFVTRGLVFIVAKGPTDVPLFSCSLPLSGALPSILPWGRQKQPGGPTLYYLILVVSVSFDIKICFFNWDILPSHFRPCLKRPYSKLPQWSQNVGLR